MVRVPENCRHRTEIEEAPNGLAVCGVLSIVTGVTDPTECVVRQDACQACCNSLRDPTEMNPVVASLVYTMASRIAANGGHPECSPAHAASLIRCASDQLSIVVREIPEQTFPPRASVPLREFKASEEVSAPFFRWATAMLTAPRSEPKIEQALESLATAGFDDVHIFAEPDAWIPKNFRDLKITQRTIRLGNFLNFYSCLSTLLNEQPDADAYAVFQDDILVASGLREWCEDQLWPFNNGVVSLFTPRLHSGREPGWNVISPGFQRVCGAQALVFRRDLLHRFLSDARVLHSLCQRTQYDDAVLGGWLAREGLGIAYHTPSPVQHVGRISSIFQGHHDLRNLGHAVRSVSEMNDWTPSPPEPGRIGLVGWNTPTGLGSINRDLVNHLGVKRWLAPPHPQISITADSIPPRVEMQTDFRSRADQQRWFAELDWLLFVERPYLDDLPCLAAHAGIGIACIPMWEWVRPDLRWLQFVDLMICPTLHTYHQMKDWTRRYGFGWKSVYVPWPIDAGRFRFRQRNICREFLFVNGWGGGSARRPDGSAVPYHRKGMELILAAAQLAPDLKFVIRSLQPIDFGLPRNVRVAPALRDNIRLYDEGDVCVQPSHYEGLGLQLLECQAAGMPLVTTDGPPMNEAHPWKTIPTCGQEVISVGGGFISSELMTPKALVETLRPLAGMDIRDVSRQARRSMETERSWETVRRFLLDELVRR